MESYRRDIDFIKGLAIIAVVLYHIGILKSGYLGVDIFFVVSGFLTVNSVYKKIISNKFNYFKFIAKKYIRLAPLVIIISFISMIIGYVAMLPNDYENLAQSIVASLGFSQNILSAITTKDYWNIINEYKPLMHLWYVGILMEFYFILPIILYFAKYISNKIKKDSKKVVLTILTIILIISLTIFLIPNFSNGNKFYYIFFRLWELILGGIVGLYTDKINNCIKNKNLFKIISIIGVILLLIIGIFNTNYITLWEDCVVPIGSKEVYSSNLIISNEIALLMIACFTSIYLALSNVEVKNKIIESIGKMSYSIFIWHQPILAFYRYFIKYELSFTFILLYLILVLLISYISYKLFEKRLKSKKTFVVSIISTVIIGIISMGIYFNAGVVRNVPELNISKENATYNMHAKYVDRIYNYDVDFSNNVDKVKVLIIGNSFARDFANILLESEINEKIELTYIYSLNNSDYSKRIENSDYIFYFGYKTDLPKYLWESISNSSNVYGIGTKNFGESNGIIYSNRFKDSYFEQTIPLNEKYEKLNNDLKKEWENNYIDLIEYVKNEDGKINVFSDNKKLISQDCHHLTEEGAKYYSKLIDFNKIIKK